MRKKSLLDSIDVPAPCPQSWDAMIGDDKARYCGSCEKDIHNISAMTRGEVKKLLFQSKESVCIRMEKDADGRIKTLKKHFHQITRQMPIAAGILSASLTLSAATQAQNKVENAQTDKTNVSQSVKDAKSAASISGTVSDSNGAIVPNAQITLSNPKTTAIQKTKSNGEGFYEFKNLESGVYELTAESDGFKKAVYQSIKIEGDKNLQLAISLETSGVTTIGVVAEMPEEVIEPSETKISDKIQARQIESLPPNLKMAILGLFASGQTKSVDKQTTQNLSQISFTIYDQIGEVISQAKVKLTDQKTKKEFSAVADKEGVARFEELPHGNYDVEISLLGFRAYRQNIQITQPIEPNLEIILETGFVGGAVTIWSEIPLFRAIEQNNSETVKRIIKSGFNLNTKDENGETALHIAVQHENTEIVRFLLDKGAKVNVKDKAQRPPLAMLFDSFEDDEKINREIIRLLVSKGANINVRDEDSQTFLMKVGEDNNLEDVKFFLELGANPNLKDEDGETAFDKTDSEEIRQLLIAHGAVH